MQCNKWSAEVWNYCVKIDKEFKDKNGIAMNMSEMQTAVKGQTNLHAKGVHHVYRKYLSARASMWKSIRAKHDNSNKVKIPYKNKKYFTSGWDYQSIGVDYKNGIIKLSTKKCPNKPVPIKCYAKTIPQNIKEIELLYRNGLKLAIKYVECNIQDVIQSDNVASIDLGEIHSITSIDTLGNAIIITGRKLRDIKRLRDKEQGKIKSKRSRCTKGSIRHRKYSRSLYNLKFKADNQINDAIHKITKLYLDFCLENNISKVYYGDLDSCTRNTKKIGKTLGQKLNEWNYGLLMLQLHNKLERYGIELVKIKEYYTSQKCPECGLLNKTSTRNYRCGCGYEQHRDIVGAMNILNDNHDTQISEYVSKKYLRIA